MKDTTVDRTVDAIRIARDLGYGVTEQLRDRSRLDRAGLRAALELRRTTRSVARRIHHSDAAAGHLVFRPGASASPGGEMVAVRQCITCCGSRGSAPNGSSSCIAKPGAGRFSISAAASRGRDWARQVKVRDLTFLTRMLIRTQRMMRADAYVREHRLAEPSGGTPSDCTACSSASPRLLLRITDTAYHRFVCACRLRWLTTDRLKAGPLRSQTSNGSRVSWKNAWSARRPPGASSVAARIETPAADGRVERRAPPRFAC